ncbi:hypothetical protein GCM10010969_25350 [Saccharibacillus kuerlensis]|uniref:DUF1963 domain-containing protein n=2 Tax=Saccharibacillus kuerlensis TaxID=459527 RepID=A0ABQ2L487_9BACL|nr:hypothetical protein GCM10010969_25350 [Saccharibacillus kuerlensis]
MPIILHSSGLYSLEAQKRFMQIVEESGLERKAVIITTADPEHAAGNGHTVQTRDMFEGLNFVVDFLDLATEPAGQLAHYSIIYLNGGNPFILLAELKNSGADRILQDLHQKGHLIIGHSAGAAVLGTTIEHFLLLNTESNSSNLTDFSGLELVQAIVLPNSNRYEERESVIELLEFSIERPEPLLKIEDNHFYVYERPTPEQRLDPEFILRKLEDAGLAKYRPDIAKLLFPSLKMKLHAVSDTEIVIGSSRVGGGADLPGDADWPEWDECPYTFIAQINLSELPEGHGLLLPEDGLLSFFYASAAMYEDYAFHGDPTTCRVIYTPPSSFKWLSTLSIPESLLQADPQVVLSPAKIIFNPDLCVPESESAYLEALGLGWGGDHIEYERYWNIFKGNLDDPQTYHVPLHRLLGHPDQIQGDMQIQCAKMFRWSSFDTSISAEEEERFARDALEWRLLLQIDCDEAANIEWVGAGRIYFWIREEDLVQQVFDRVICIVQNT